MRIANSSYLVAIAKGDANGDRMVRGVFSRKLRDAVAPPYRWLAEKLCMGKPGSVRAYVHAARPAVAVSDSQFTD